LKGNKSENSANVARDESSDDALVVIAGCAETNDKWVLDTACSFHMCPYRDWFNTLDSTTAAGSVLGFDNSQCKIEGIGSIRIKMSDGTIRTLTDVRYIPKMKRNLISLSALDAKGYKYSGGDNVLKVTKGSLIVMKGDLSLTNGLYYLRGSTVLGNATPAVSNNSDCDAANLWHMRLGHMSELGLAELNKKGLLASYQTGKLKFCEHCIFGKHKRVKFNTSTHTTEGILDYVHSDLWGPSRRKSLGGASYMLTIIDDYSRKVWPYFLKHEYVAFSTFKEWKIMIERQT